VPGREIRSEELEKITEHASLARGLGRSYGDASLPASHVQEVVGTTLADRILAFDDSTGVLRVEAGLSLAEMNRIFLPRNFFTPVTPGTKYVTLGGMVASDVHGKNHHVAGTLGRHVRALKLRVGDGRIVECSRQHEPQLFLATLGGQGLTGHIIEVELQLVRIPSPWIFQESHRMPDLDSFVAALRHESTRWPFTVGWTDIVARGPALGRGILFCGRWAAASEAPAAFPRPKPGVSMPFALPSGILNRSTIRLFNSVVFHQHFSRVKRGHVDPDTFFYPLDRVQRWNLMYGKRGVTQHQSVLPHAEAVRGMRAMIEVLRSFNAASFLTVIKDCGAEGEGMLSFPKPGMSLALDIPIRDNTQQVIDGLNECVIACGGRIYLTKDGFTRPEHFQVMDPRVPAFLAVRRQWDPEHNICSAQSERLFGKS
jgi:FAD/FMN-containing dehydrogenase